MPYRRLSRVAITIMTTFDIALAGAKLHELQELVSALHHYALMAVTIASAVLITNPADVLDLIGNRRVPFGRGRFPLRPLSWQEGRLKLTIYSHN